MRALLRADRAGHADLVVLGARDAGVDTQRGLQRYGPVVAHLGETVMAGLAAALQARPINSSRSTALMPPCTYPGGPSCAMPIVQRPTTPSL
ncbi:MAG: hypothetical protein HOY79_32975 [Streptomyces sp.]|nr:hypothetical protein [Streptomyces sp.]